LFAVQSFIPVTNNGNVWKQRIIRPQFSAEQEYNYDALNRISGMYESAAVNRAYNYDRYGNRYVETSSSQIPSPIAPEPTMPGHFNTANNRLAMTGTGFDAAGNQTTLAPYTLEYDAEGRNTVVKLSGASYATFSYDGEGRRVRKAMNGGDTTYYLYDALGQMAVEYSTDTASSTGSSYLFADMLGSVRTITNDVGAVVECYDYLPFGRMLGSGVGGRGSCYPDPPDANYDSRAPQKFTGKERDAETGLDYFGARYYSGPQGRFTTPDPENAGAMEDDPQSWNGYAYARNNPLKYTDPYGLAYQLCTPGGGCIYDYSDSDFYWYFQSDPSVTLENGTIWANGQIIGYYSHLYDDPWTTQLKEAFTNNHLPDLYQQRAEQNLKQGNYLAYALDKFGTWFFPRSYIGSEGVMFAASFTGQGLTGKALFKAAAAEGMTAEKFISLFRKGSINSVFPGELKNALLKDIEAAAKAGDAAARTAWKLLTDNRFAK
jgi:RHS repeat-associated protein